jgi:hypothetical protein
VNGRANDYNEWICFYEQKGAKSAPDINAISSLTYRMLLPADENLKYGGVYTIKMVFEGVTALNLRPATDRILYGRRNYLRILFKNLPEE